MSLRNCQNRIKPIKKKPYAQIILKFGANAQPNQKELREPANQNIIYDLSEKIQLASQESAIYQKFSRASSRQSSASRKEKYRRSVYRNQQDNGKESYVFKSPTKQQRVVIAEPVTVSDTCKIYKRLSVMEKQHNSTQLMKKAFEKNCQKTIKPGSKQKYRKSCSSRQSANPRYSINSDTSEQFSQWIEKNISIDSDYSDNQNPEHRKNRASQNRIIQTSFSMQSQSKYSQSIVFSQKNNKSNSNIMDYNHNDYSNVQQVGSIAQAQQCVRNKDEQEDLQQMFFGKIQTKQSNGKQQNFVKYWQQKSVFIQKKLCMIKQDTHENDSDSSVSQQQNRKPRIQSEILFPSRKNPQYQPVHFDRNFQKKETSNREDIELEKAIMKDKALRKQIQKARLEYQSKKTEKKIIGQVKQQPECMIM